MRGIGSTTLGRSCPTTAGDSPTTLITTVVEKYADQLIDFRRDLHAHPELAWTESRTTDEGDRGARGHRLGRSPDRGRRPDRRDRYGGAASRAAGRPRRAAGRGPHHRPVGQHRARRGPRLRPRRAHGRAGGRGPRPRTRCTRAVCLPGRVRLLFQPAEEIMPGGALHLIQAGALDDVHQVFGLHCDPSLDVGQPRAARGAAHRRRRLTVRPARRQGRAHESPAPHRGPHLRARQADHRAARDPQPPPRPARRRQPGVGHGPGRCRRQRDPRSGHARRHRAHARRGRVGRRRAHRPHPGGPDRRAVRRLRRGHLPARRAAGRQRRSPPRRSSPGRSSGCSATTATSPRPRAWAARTSAGTSTGSPARWPGSAPARRVDRPTTSTRATCGSTSARPAIGARVLAEAAVARAPRLTRAGYSFR